jgi:hypothetical protein
VRRNRGRDRPDGDRLAGGREPFAGIDDPCDGTAAKRDGTAAKRDGTAGERDTTAAKRNGTAGERDGIAGATAGRADDPQAAGNHSPEPAAAATAPPGARSVGRRGAEASP